ncbi:hypothetical protein ROZALSC1DRAFT_22164 [Rozella allomycis CSF55]|uniref:RNI-like protein n=1 Tax=Rozella allomycis (strain CSF55) TaxID=988480 RepID=A0A4P9YJ36_ROZAC|nr:hypothetical protein ROZALSC1DRAFT_22164 [Rozella allomycis CSF55]
MKFTDQLVKFQNFQIPSVSKYSFDNCTFEHPDSLSGHVKQLTLKNQKIDQVLQILKTLSSSLFVLNLDRLVMENVAQLNKLKELELPKLAKLKISNSNLNLAACEILSAFMVNMPSLKVLDLSGNSIAATDCKLLIDLALVVQKRTLALIIN